MKKTIGYAFKLSSESYERAIKSYWDGGFSKSRKEVKEDIAKGKALKNIRLGERPKIFKVMIEIQ